MEPRLQRVKQSVPLPGRTLPTTPLDAEEPDGGDLLRPGGPNRFGRGGEAPKRDSVGGDWPERPRSRPASRICRIFLTLAALVVLGGLATSAYFLKSCLDRDSRFRINAAGNIETTGLTEVNRAELLPVFGEDIGRNIFFVPLSERRRQLEAIPWIEKATVMRLLPNQIRVSVIERQPVAFMREGQQIGLVDASGVLLSMPAAMMARRHYSFPVVTGIDARAPLPARQERMAVYLRLLAELDASGQKISSQISEVDLTNSHDAQVLMQDDSPLLHFGEDHFLERYQRYKTHIAEWRRQYPKLAAVDLRYEQQVVLEMAAGADVAQAAADEQAARNATDGEQPALRVAEDGHAASGPLDKPVPTAKAGAKQAPLSAVKSKAAKTNGKKVVKNSSSKNSVAAKGRAAKAITVKARANEKKRAEAKRAALSVIPRKTAPIYRPAVSAGQGQ